MYEGGLVVVLEADDQLLVAFEDAGGQLLLRRLVVVVTHELESAFKIADRITVLDRGHVLAVEPVEDLKRNPNPRIQNLLNRRSEEPEIDRTAYLQRLAGGT